MKKKQYIKFMILIFTLLILIGAIGYFRIIDKSLIRSMLKEYKQELCTVNISDDKSFSNLNEEGQIEFTAYLESFKKYFTEEGFKGFFGDRRGSVYRDYVEANPDVSLKFKGIKYDKFEYDSENNRYIVNYKLQIQASDDQIYTETIQSVIIKENGQWKIDHEKIYNYGSMFNN
ncbi:hypothetical protein [Fusibacter ferrireducens]|uniref:DUF4829 domain-containing protein n=1 Tax=Fusibacter ferrireducens TaxID=2785058 RepID=A0ABR9ZP83_9FIRM|nr:hypothetical protein [Fusibacter ferrireducens]MBF4691801.1 hypothetical protein [Fusibacter ferrireducens]